MLHTQFHPQEITKKRKENLCYTVPSALLDCFDGALGITYNNLSWKNRMAQRAIYGGKLELIEKTESGGSQK